MIKKILKWIFISVSAVVLLFVILLNLEDRGYLRFEREYEKKWTEEWAFSELRLRAENDPTYFLNQEYLDGYYRLRKLCLGEVGTFQSDSYYYMGNYEKISSIKAKKEYLEKYWLYIALIRLRNTNNHEIVNYIKGLCREGEAVWGGGLHFKR